MGRVIESPATPEDVLAPLRRRIDVIDAAIVGLLAERMDVVGEVVSRKLEAGIPARLNDRVEAVVAHVRGEAGKRRCPPDLAEAVWRTLIEWTIAHEERQLP